MRTTFAIFNNMKRISKCVGGGGEMKLLFFGISTYDII